MKLQFFKQQGIKNGTAFYASILYWFAILIIYFYLHEFAGHYLANWLSGISPEQMEILWAETNNVKIFPYAINIPGIEASKTSVISRFSGGFISGLLLLLLAMLLWRLLKKKGQSLYLWFFAITLGFSCVGFTESIFEGFFLKYHRSIIETTILSFFVFVLPVLIIAGRYLIHKRST